MTPYTLTPTTVPKRYQRSRRKGTKLPAGVVYVGRPTKWGNPFTREAWGQQHGGMGERAFLAFAYRWWLMFDPDGREMAERAAKELVGRNLAWAIIYLTNTALPAKILT